MRAIDLYAGIGGWSLGLRLAGIDVVASYEWWQPAIDTHNGNHGGQLTAVDIRKLRLEDLPTNIDLVVGSPPCTEFSYANRGGSGNIAEGLKDIVKFFEVVEHLKPRHWAMENVPRVADVLRTGFRDPDHPLYRFRRLNPHIEVYDLSDFGTPQARKRCIAGNIPFELLDGYRPKTGLRTLGDVVCAVTDAVQVTDPNWGAQLRAAKLTEMEKEPSLNAEELRMNREAKAYHPVYNNMAFPDPLDEPSRTVTATCTRVSRESIVINDSSNTGAFRRLTIRERACLQGFPITYQFYAKSFSDKAKMVGNAIPPTFTYLLALAAKGVPPEAFAGFHEVSAKLSLPETSAPVTKPDSEGRTYPPTRAFRAALPGLRFKSGMRFELCNLFSGEAVEWKTRFLFGSSKDIREVELDGSALRDLRRAPLIGNLLSELRPKLMRAEAELTATTPKELQAVWTHRSEGLSPYEVTDMLGDLAAELLTKLDSVADEAVRAYVVDYVIEVADDDGSGDKLPGLRKLEKYALPVLCGFVVGDWFNTLPWHSQRRAAA